MILNHNALLVEIKSDNCHMFLNVHNIVWVKPVSIGSSGGDNRAYHFNVKFIDGAVQTFEWLYRFDQQRDPKTVAEDAYKYLIGRMGVM